MKKKAAILASVLCLTFVNSAFAGAIQQSFCPNGGGFVKDGRLVRAGTTLTDAQADQYCRQDGYGALIQGTVVVDTTRMPPNGFVPYTWYCRSNTCSVGSSY